MMANNGKTYGNALFLYGGGLCALAADGIAYSCEIAKSANVFGKVYVGYYSFLALTNETLIYDWEKCGYDSQKYGGGHFGTCRNVDLTNPILKRKAIQICKNLEIRWIFIGGGDGSSRQVAEIAADFWSEGISLCFFMPFTLDGINGGLSVGIKPAVTVSLYCINQTAGTFLNTLEGNRVGGAIYELQGRNRDDILLNVLKRLTEQKLIGDYDASSVEVIALPANLPWLPTKLEAKISESRETQYFSLAKGIKGVPTIILLSEGASISKETIVKIAANNGMKYRSFTVGHLSQMNDMVSDDERTDLKLILESAFKLAFENLEEGPFTIVFENEKSAPRVEPIDYFAKLNPRKAQQQVFTLEEAAFLRNYMP